MNILFIGLGSIAGRHIRNLRELLQDKIHITVLRSGNGSTAASGADLVVYTPDDLAPWYDAIFITNPTSLHYDTLCEFLSYSDNFFIEKPVFMTGEEELQPFLHRKKRYYVACPLRYMNVIRYLKANVDFSNIYSVRCIASSYLPDWRKGVDYRNTYSARSELGGGVSIDLIHEWDYLYYLLGKPLELKSIIRKKSDLEIDSNDVSIYIAEYPSQTAEVHLDYFGRKPIRNIELFGKEDTISADLLAQKIDWLNRGATLSFPEPRNEFQKRELRHFLRMIDQSLPSDHDLAEASQILRIARGNL